MTKAGVRSTGKHCSEPQGRLPGASRADGFAAGKVAWGGSMGRPRTPIRRLAAAWILAVAVSPTMSMAATPATLVGPDLKARPVNLQSVGEGQVSYFDAQRVYRTESLERII